jgi:hypothetical protein
MTIMYAGVLGGGGNDAVQFWDGSNVANKARLRTNSSNLIQSYGTLAFWVKLNSLTLTVATYLFNAATDGGIRGLQVRIGSGGALIFAAIDSAGSSVLSVTASGFFSLDVWTHVMLEWDCTGTNKYVKIAYNGNFYSNTTISNSNVFLITNSLTLNGTPVNTNAQEPVSLYDLWYDLINPDISLSATREKFILSGSPVNLGANGSLPFGSQPRLFLSGAFSQWKQNKGSATLLDTNSGQSGFFNPNTPNYFTKSPTKPM